MLNISSFPELTTDRLVLRQLEDKDLLQIFKLRTNQQINKYIDRPLMAKPEEALEFIRKMSQGFAKKEWLYWGVAFKEKPLLLGTICLWNFSLSVSSADLGYELLPEFQKQGIMLEAVGKIVDYGLTILKLATIEAHTNSGNKPSRRLLEKADFVYHDAYNEQPAGQTKTTRMTVYEIRTVPSK